MKKALCMIAVIATVISMGSVSILAAENETERAAFYEYIHNVLVPQYGVMDTTDRTSPSSYGVEIQWGRDELTGLLSATINDFDQDGHEELLAVYAETLSEREVPSGEQEGTDLYLMMYEYNAEDGVLPSAQKVLTACRGFRTTMGYGQIGVFTYEYDGILYLAVDNHMRANESIATLDILRYEDLQLKFVKAIGFQSQGSGYLAVKEAVEEQDMPTFCSGWRNDTIREEFVPDYENGHDMLTEEEAAEFFQTYGELMKENGLYESDYRLWHDQTAGGGSGYYWQDGTSLYTMPEIYAADSDRISFICGIYTYAETWETLNLLRRDYEGTLDEYRVQEPAADALIPDIQGKWVHDQQVRISINIAEMDAGVYRIEVIGSGGAMYHVYWEMTGLYDVQQNAFVYTNGKKYEEAPDANGELKRELMYADGQGKFFIEAGYLKWQDDKENAGYDCSYENNEYCSYEKYSETPGQFVLEAETTEALADEGTGSSNAGTEAVNVEALAYILPDSGSRYLTEADLSGLSMKEICYAKNEIYAKHGRKFLSLELADYFSAQSWYSGTIEPGAFTEEMVNNLFNEYEKANVKLLAQWEARYGAYEPR